MRRMDGLYDAMVARGFSPHPVLCGMSRGGLDTANWAAHRPGAPAAIVLDNPLLDIRSWPLGAGASKGGTAENRENAKLVQALADTVVPPEENGLPFLAALRAAGGVCETIEKPGADHHPHSLDPPDRIVEFIERHRPL